MNNNAITLESASKKLLESLSLKEEALHILNENYVTKDLKNLSKEILKKHIKNVEKKGLIEENYTLKDKFEIFIRDGFIDRYTGEKLVIPGMLKVLSTYFPEDFSYNPNWKMSETHIAYWELYPCIDYVTPLYCGGNNSKSNIVTTSLPNSNAKNNRTLHDIGWELQKAGNLSEWDGLSKIFIAIVEKDTALLTDSYIKKWYKLAKEYFQKTINAHTFDKALIIEESSKLILNGDKTSAINIINSKYAFNKEKKYDKRSFSNKEKMEVFIRDGFIDRYTGEKLVIPGMLKVFSIYYPEDFPYQSNWKMSETHIAYWDLYPTIDHIEPIAYGGKDSKENMVTTSMQNNSIKSNWPLEKIGWTIHSVGNINEWDGLSKTFIRIVENDSTLLNDSYVKIWYKLAKEYF